MTSKRAPKVRIILAAWTVASAAVAEAQVSKGGTVDRELALSVESALTISDNINLAPGGQEEDGFRLEVTPRVAGRINRPQVRGWMDYRLRNFYTHPDVGYEGPSHDLRAIGNAALSGEWFWLSGQAFVYDVNTSPFVASSSVPGSREQNRSRYRRFDLLPYVRGRLDLDTDYEAGYGLNWIDYGGATPNSVGHSLRGRVENNPEVGQIGWLVRGITIRRDFEGNDSYDTAFALLAGWYRFDRTLKVGAGSAYNRISVLSDASGETSGWGPAGLLDWTPTPRTSVLLEGIHAYYGNILSANVTHLWRDLSFGLRYRRSVIDGAEASVIYYDRGAGLDLDRYRSTEAGVDDAYLADAGILPQFGTPLGGGLLASALVERELLELSAGWSRQRNSIGVALYISRNKSLQTTEPLPAVPGGLDDLEQQGVVVTYRRLLSPDLSAVVRERYVRSQSDTSRLSSNLSVFELALERGYLRSLYTTIGYRRVDQRGDGAYRENAIIAALRYRF